MKRAVQLTVACLGGLALVLALLLLINRATPVRADPGVLYVAPGGNCNGASPCYGNVQAAVDAAAAGDEIRVTAGTYTGVESRPCPFGYEGSSVITQIVYLTKTVTIQGGYSTSNWNTADPKTNPTTLDAQGQGRVIFIMGDISPTIEGLRITGGSAIGQRGTPWPSDAGGGVYVKDATVTISNCRIINNTSGESAFAGGVYLIGSDAILIGNTVSDNNASWGGGLHVTDSDIILDGNTITSNSAWYGGGLDIRRSTATVSANSLSANVASYDGGGLYLAGNVAITLTGNIVTDNTASQDGGGLRLATRGEYLLTNNVIADNQASGAGSGLCAVGSTAHLLHNTIARNSGCEGIYVTDYYNVYTGDYLSATACLTDTILVSHTVGISAAGGSTVTVNSVLWDSTPITVSRSVTATVMVQDEHTGDPVFASDGYHLTAASAAMDAGIDAGVITDIDNHHRPYGSAPDLGADEVFAFSVPPDVESALVYTDTQGNPAVIQVPTGAVTETVILIYVPADTVTPLPGFAFANRAFDLDAYQGGSLLSGFAFSTPVTITLYYADSDVIGRGEDTLVLNYWDGGGWVDAASTCTPTSIYDRYPDENWLAVPVCHLSRFALFGEQYTVYLPLALRNHE